MTGVGLPAASQRVAAIAVGGHEIVATGDDATVLRLKQPGTRLVDLKGAFVMPGSMMLMSTWRLRGRPSSVWT